MQWRAMSNPSSGGRAETKKGEMERRVCDGVPIGILGYVDGQPVAWCSIAPRETYRSSMWSPNTIDDGERIWSIACFFILRKFRGQGFFHQLMSAAEHYAITLGATVVEGYPVEPDSPSYRFGGFLPAFEQAGYALTGRKGLRRHVVRKRLLQDAAANSKA